MNVSSEQRSTDELTRSEWRRLGFHYDRDDSAREWLLTGSRSGLLRFRDLLLEYAAKPGNSLRSEHEHYGPYSYLEVMTWNEAGIDNHAIYGSLDDIRRLALLIEERIASANPGATIVISDEYTKAPAYSLVLSVREDGFDPASADRELM